eukprot:3040293-Heterocapsa_arctica.AAC.1
MDQPGDRGRDEEHHTLGQPMAGNGSAEQRQNHGRSDSGQRRDKASQGRDDGERTVSGSPFDDGSSADTDGPRTQRSTIGLSR